MSQGLDEEGLDPERQTAADPAEAVLFEQIRQEFLDQRGIDPTRHLRDTAASPSAYDQG
jgi:hypothetical protein